MMSYFSKNQKELQLWTAVTEPTATWRLIPGPLSEKKLTTANPPP